jgi:glycosyltransferase involved in cell wall biosynthesis
VVILESFACGVPVISSQVGGIHEHLNEERGALVEAGNEDQFLKMLNHILDQLSRFNKQEIRQYAIDHFSQEVIGKQLFDIYSSISKH